MESEAVLFFSWLMCLGAAIQESPRMSVTRSMPFLMKGSVYSEDHPRTSKWLTMVIVSRLTEVIPLPNGLNGVCMGLTSSK